MRKGLNYIALTIEIGQARQMVIFSFLLCNILCFFYVFLLFYFTIFIVLFYCIIFTDICAAIAMHHRQQNKCYPQWCLLAHFEATFDFSRSEFTCP